MTVQLRFVGSGGAFGSGGRFQTCLHLSGGDGDVLMDCGASSLIARRIANTSTLERRLPRAWCVPAT